MQTMVHPNCKISFERELYTKKGIVLDIESEIWKSLQSEQNGCDIGKHLEPNCLEMHSVVLQHC